MATAFRATTKGYRSDLEQHERRLLSSLCADVITLLETRDEETREAADSSTGEPGNSGDPAEDPAFAHFRAELAGLGVEEPLAAPDDAVLRRLLPDAFTDEEESGHFRRLSENSLRGAKIADLRTARMLLESSPIHVDDNMAPIFGRALNDLRLTLATRLELETEQDAERIHALAVKSGSKNSEAFMAEIYTFITWLQESLFGAMTEFLPEPGDSESAQGPDGEASA